MNDDNDSKLVPLPREVYDAFGRIPINDDEFQIGLRNLRSMEIIVDATFLNEFRNKLEHDPILFYGLETEMQSLAKRISVINIMMQTSEDGSKINDMRTVLPVKDEQGITHFESVNLNLLGAYPNPDLPTDDMTIVKDYADHFAALYKKFIEVRPNFQKTCASCPKYADGSCTIQDGYMEMISGIVS